MTSPTVRLWYALLVSFVATIVVAMSCLWWTAAQQRESDVRWCRLMVALDNAYTSNPPRTPVGRDIAQQIHELRRSLGCDVDKE